MNITRSKTFFNFLQIFYEFFIYFLAVTQGTVTPTHMVVVQENTRSGKKFQPDDIQKLAYKLTHMYFNWPGTVRVPAPCQVDNVLKMDFL